MLAIGSYHLQSRVLLAPMAGVTDLPFRQLCQAQGAGLTTSEMVIAKTQHWGSEKSRLRFLPTTNTDIPHSIQIVGGDAQTIAEAAIQAAAAGAEIIDINMGCPAKKVCKKAAGSALLKDELLVADILESVVASVAIPVTLKIRTGWDLAHRNAVEIAKIAESSGIQALAVHGRTRACRFVGDVEFETIAAVKQAINIPVFANGDIDSVEKALSVVAYTQADGVMVGRGAQGQPWLIRQIIDAMDGGKAGLQPDFEIKRQCMFDHLNAIHQFYRESGDYKMLGFARKHMSCYLEKLQFEKNTRKAFNQLDSVVAQRNYILQLQDPQLVK